MSFVSETWSTVSLHARSSILDEMFHSISLFLSLRDVLMFSAHCEHSPSLFSPYAAVRGQQGRISFPARPCLSACVRISILADEGAAMQPHDFIWIVT